MYGSFKLIAPKVVLKSLDNYDQSGMDNAVSDIFSTLSDQIVIRRGDTVLIKPNFIAPKPRQSGAVTDPAVLIAVAKVLLDIGAKPFVADSPAWGNIAGCIRVLGCKDEFDKLGVKIKQLDSPVKTYIDGSRVGISRLALEADRIINVPKFKAHQQLGATFAIKNMFGCVAGKEKAIWHLARGKDYERFCRLLVEIYKKLAPALTIIDGITAMEGAGPLNGNPKQLGVIVAGTDPVACERVCAEIAGFDLNILGLFNTAKEMNLGCGQLDRIEVIGESFDNLKCTDFAHPEQIEIYFSLSRVCKSIFKQIVQLVRPPYQRGSTPSK